jgi:hypothetical protein
MSSFLEGTDDLNEDEINKLMAELGDGDDLTAGTGATKPDWNDPKLGEPEADGARFVGAVKSRMESNKFFVFCQEVADLSDGKDAKITWKSKPPPEMKVGDWIEFTLVREFPEAALDSDWGSPLAIEIEVIERPVGILLPWETVEGEWQPPDDGVRFHSLKVKAGKKKATGGHQETEVVVDPAQAQKKAIAYRERAAAYSENGGKGAGDAVNAFGEPLRSSSYGGGKGTAFGKGDAWGKGCKGGGGKDKGGGKGISMITPACKGGWGKW